MFSVISTIFSYVVQKSLFPLLFIYEPRNVKVQFILEQENTTSTVNVDVKEAMVKSLSLPDTLYATEWI